MSKRWIPFWLFPGSWGLKGQTRQIAEAEYLFSDDPYMLQRKLNCIKYQTGKELEIAQLKTNLQFAQMDRESGLRRLAELESVHEQDRNLRLLEIDREFHRVDPLEYEKQLATIKGLPWVIVKNFDTDKKNPAHGSLDLDWNDAFIEHLESNGYGPNPQPEDTVDQWLSELCRNIALETFDGVGETSERLHKKSVHEDVVFKSDLKKNGDEK